MSVINQMEVEIRDKIINSANTIVAVLRMLWTSWAIIISANRFQIAKDVALYTKNNSGSVKKQGFHDE